MQTCSSPKLKAFRQMSLSFQSVWETMWRLKWFGRRLHRLDSFNKVLSHLIWLLAHWHRWLYLCCVKVCQVSRMTSCGKSWLWKKKWASKEPRSRFSLSQVAGENRSRFVYIWHHLLNPQLHTIQGYLSFSHSQLLGRCVQYFYLKCIALITLCSSWHVYYSESFYITNIWSQLFLPKL